MILILFLISTLYVLFILLKTLWTLYVFKSKSKPSLQPHAYAPVSVIICTKNEADNLSQHLDSILSQNHPCFEVIIIDDFSTDNTVEVVKQFQHDFHNLRLVYSKDKNCKSKRSALKQGVENAKYDIILLTDADSRPVSKHWIKIMTSQLSEDNNCVLGYSPYSFYPSFLNHIIQYETLQTAVLYFSMAIQHKAYMGVGRNIMYRKSTFLESENFTLEYHLTSGDDDLLVQKILEKSKITVCLHPDSFVLSKPKRRWASWWKQKQRHYSTANHYQFSHQMYLGAYHVFQLIFWISCIALIFSSYHVISLSIFILYLAISSLIWLYFAKLFKVSRSVIGIWPILGFSLLIFQTSMGMQSFFQKQTTWQ